MATISVKRKPMGACMWRGCKWPGRFFQQRKSGIEPSSGYCCDEHERKIAQENLGYPERIQVDKKRNVLALGQSEEG